MALRIPQKDPSKGVVNALRQVQCLANVNLEIATAEAHFSPNLGGVT